MSEGNISFSYFSSIILLENLVFLNYEMKIKFLIYKVVDIPYMSTGLNI